MHIAFKEWSVICEFLARGKQSIILRKGGISEDAGQFEPKHKQFWLFPTRTHQQLADIQPVHHDECQPWLTENDTDEDSVAIQYYASVEGIYFVRELLTAQLLAHLHVWSDDAVDKKFHYRNPGLYVLMVRVFQVPSVHWVTNSPEYRGCKTWIELVDDLPTQFSSPVLSDQAFDDLRENLDRLLNPTMLA